MQMVISQLAFTFVDDAIALAKGFGDSCRDLAVGIFTAARRRILAPVDRLARACDVGGVIAAREAAMTRFRHLGANRRRLSAPRRWHDRLNPFRGLSDLT